MLENTNTQQAQTQKVQIVYRKPKIYPWLIAGAVISILFSGLSSVGVWYYLEIYNPKVRDIVIQKDVRVTQVDTIDQNSEVIKASKLAVKSVVSVVGMKGDKDVSAGSGFIVDKNGYIVTNKHVVNDAETYKIVLDSGVTINVEKVWKDETLDIAILKVNPENQDFVPLELASSEEVELGQNVIAIGNSLGEFSNSVSAGIVSGLSRSIVAGDSMNSNQEVLENVIQTDASINSGNSGGPLLNIKGQVIAVNVAKANDGENVGFAIPISVVKPIIKSVLDKGYIARPYIGIKYLAISPEMAKKNNLSVSYGVILQTTDNADAVVKDSPAQKAGLQKDDIILEFNGEKITLTNSLAFNVRKHSVGDKITLKVLRGGQESIVEVELGSFSDKL